jgi:hypothetical protein
MIPYKIIILFLRVKAKHGGKEYYWHAASGETTYEHPAIKDLKAKGLMGGGGDKRKEGILIWVILMIEFDYGKFRLQYFLVAIGSLQIEFNVTRNQIEFLTENLIKPL